MVRGRGLGALIGAVGGVVFVIANAGPLPGSGLWRGAGVVLFVAAVVVALRAPDDGSGPPSPRALRVYGWCVVGEVVAIPLGAAILRALERPELTLPWVVLVLGVHFVPFAKAFGEPVFAGLGWLLVGLAIAGSVATLLIGSEPDLSPSVTDLPRSPSAVLSTAEPDQDPTAPAWTAVTAGFVLLAFSIGGVLASPRASRRAA